MKRGPAAVKAWCEKNDIKPNALGERVGDRHGHVAKWINGNRDSIPLRVKVAIARETGLRLGSVVDADELETARELFAVFARDCAGNAA
jgi:hypothetical protein